VLLWRRRRRRPSSGDEERESLWSWDRLGTDLRDLLGSLRRRPRPDQGLRAALARLQGSDPASRIRRRYIQLLLIGEQRDHPRPAPQTPREYLPGLVNDLPAASAAIAALTDSYEQARYHPEGLVARDVDRADQAWQQITTTDQSS